MPIYTYECNVCEQEAFTAWASIKDRKNVVCPSCKELAEQMIVPIKMLSDVSGMWEHIGWDPIEIKGREHLREVTKRYGCYATGVLDGDHRKEI